MDISIAIDRHHTVTVAIEGEADRGVRLQHPAAQRADFRRATFKVDVPAVGFVRHQFNAGTEPRENLARHAVSGTVGTVKDDLETVQFESKRCLECPQVADFGGPPLGDAAGPVSYRRRILDQCLHPGLRLVVELATVAAEQLDAVVPVGIVRGRYCRGHIEPVLAAEQGGCRGRQDPAEQDVTSGLGNPGSQGGLEHRTRFTGVADDQDPWPVHGQGGSAGPADGNGEFCIQDLADAAADSVRAEQFAG